MGLWGNDLRRFRFNDVRVPLENVLGETREGFHIAMEILNNGRIGLGTGSVGSLSGRWTRRSTTSTIATSSAGCWPTPSWSRTRSAGWSRPVRARGDVPRDLRPGRRRRARLLPGVGISKVSGTEFRGRGQRHPAAEGGRGLPAHPAVEKVLRDIRIFPIFEGANDVLRAFVALSGLKPLGEKLSAWRGGPLGSDRLDRGADRLLWRPDPARGAPRSDHQGAPRARESRRSRLRPGQGAARVSESLLRKHKREIVSRQYAQKRLADSVADIYAQVAVLSRVSSIFTEHGVEPSGQERYIAETFCTRAARRVRSRFERLEDNDDERISAIAKLAYRRGEYGYALFND